MTQRFQGFLVVLENDIREDDAEAIITALKMVKGVLRVEPIETDLDHGAIASIRRDEKWRQGVYELLEKMRK